MYSVPGQSIAAVGYIHEVDRMTRCRDNGRLKISLAVGRHVEFVPTGNK